MGIRLFIADDHDLIRAGIVGLLKGTEIEIVGQAESGDEVLRQARSMSYDVLLLDLRMPGGDGFSVLENIHELLPHVKVLVLTNYNNPMYVARAQAWGVQGYLLKDITRERLVNAIRTVAAGGKAWSTEAVRQAATSVPAIEEPLAPRLTRRETQVLQQLALGLNNLEISQTLKISVETVKEHVHHILKKLGVAGRTQAALWAHRHGFGKHPG